MQQRQDLFLVLQNQILVLYNAVERLLILRDRFLIL
jgi:hypothetical protein